MITHTFYIQEKQLKKVRAKQKRLQAILGGEDIQRVEAELLADDDGDDGEEVVNFTHINWFNSSVFVLLTHVTRSSCKVDSHAAINTVW